MPFQFKCYFINQNVKYEFFLKLAYEELNLLGLWRKGAKYRTRLTRETFKAGDVLLLGVRD